MTTDHEASFKFVNAITAIVSSLRLKDVLDATVIQYSRLAQVNKIAVFLADQEGKCFHLMATKGYSAFSLEQMKFAPFQVEGILSELLHRRTPITIKLNDQFGGFNKAVFDKEQSVNQMALPLSCADLLVGAILMDSSTPLSLSDKDTWQLMTDLTASTIANAIIFGRSEYERERLNTFYKALSAFQTKGLSLAQALQKTADAVLVLGNTPYCAVLLCEPGNAELRLAAFKGLDGASLSEFDLTEATTLIGRTLSEGKTQIVKRLSETTGIPKAMGGTSFHSLLVLPLIYNSKKLGVIEIFSTDNDAFQQEQIELLEALTGQVSSAIYLAQSRELAVEQIAHDPHTGLLNRLYFKSALQAEIERSQRYGHQLALWLIDIDYLSRINDTFGQAVGDEIITKIAQVIKETLREIDLVYRFGGEQFAVILPETAREALAVIIERLREKIKNSLTSDVGVVTVSIGISTYPAHSENLNELINLAEEALFIAKYKGRDQSVEAPTTASGADTEAWMTLAKHAKHAISLERQERAKSHLNNSADYANWLLRIKNGAKKKAAKKDQVSLS